MKSLIYLLEIDINIQEYKFALISMVTAFIVTIICIPPLLGIIKKFSLFDAPNGRKIHTTPVPTMGGIAIIAGMIAALFLWFPFTKDTFQICFFLSLLVLFALGIMDDLKDLPARYKLLTQAGIATLITL